MKSRFYPLAVGHSTRAAGVFTSFAMNLTVADLVMSDGSRLEGVGVVPDFPVGPSGYALLKKTDPLLSYAASKFGAQLTPEKAGAFYFLRKKPETEDNADEDTDGGH